MRHMDVLGSVVKAIIPFQPQIRRLKRRLQPYTDNADNSNYCVIQGLEQIRLLQAAGVNLECDILEYGSGWLPIIPLLFRLAGARRLILTDMEQLMDDHTIERAAEVILENLPAVSTFFGTNQRMVRDCLYTVFRPDYLVPWSAHQHPTASVDLIISRAVLEHVSPVALEDTFHEFGRILRPDGHMCHTIDNSDHWEHVDKSISRLDFLRYDGLYWRLACLNRQAFQNRLRHSDYLKLFARHGWTAVVAEGVPDPTSLYDLMKLPLAPQFVHYDHDDLAILTSTFVLQRAL